MAKDETNEPAPGRSAAAILNLAGGPAAFLLMAALPIPAMGYAIRCSFGLLIWMAWWWISSAVPLGVTGFLPLVAASLFNFLPASKILPSYSEELIILLLGANLLSTVWSRWGLDRRIALVSLIGVGTSTRAHIMAWFAVATVLSSVLPNTIVAAAMMPLVVAMLRFVGIHELHKSAYGTALGLAVAWGTSVGGFATPLGGAPNLLAIKFLQQSVITHEFLFMTWVTRFLPITVVIVGVSFLFMRFVIRPEMESVQGTRAYFSAELKNLGAMTVPEKWALLLFAGATGLAFTRQLYSGYLPGFNPAFAFLSLGVACFVVRHKGEPLLRWDYAQKNMEWGLFYLFAGGTALGEILSQTGTAKYIADALLPYASGGIFQAVLIFSLLTMIMTQITSNTAAVAITVPITISTFQSLGLNPIPFVYIVTISANCGFMLPSSAGGPAVAAGYGINLKTMFTKGLWLTLVTWLLILIVGYLLAIYWPGFSVA